MWIWRAFNRLSTTRPRGNSTGPISYRETMKYADELELGPNERDFLWDVIQQLDRVFIKFITDAAKTSGKRGKRGK